MVAATEKKDESGSSCIWVPRNADIDRHETCKGDCAKPARIRLELLYGTLHGIEGCTLPVDHEWKDRRCSAFITFYRLEKHAYIGIMAHSLESRT